MATNTLPSKRENKAGARWYKVEDQEYPSVTTILQVIGKPALIAWSAKVERELVTNVSAQLYEDLAGTPKMTPPAYRMTLAMRLGKEKANQKELAKASDIGSQAHRLIEWNLKASMMEDAGPSPHISDKAQWAFMAWEDWKRSVNLKPIWIEQTVWSKQHGYAGTMDLFAEVNGKPTVVDWKTGKAIYPEAYLQNAAYRHALREMGHGDAVQGIIVRLPKNTEDPEFEAQIVQQSEESLFQVFLHTFELWKWNQIGEREYQAKIDAKKCEEVAHETLGDA
jgi:hypothetical protein